MLQSQLAKGPQFMTKWASVSWECKPHLLPIRTVITETNRTLTTKNIPNVGEVIEKLEPLCIAGRDVKW